MPIFNHAAFFCLDHIALPGLTFFACRCKLKAVPKEGFDLQNTQNDLTQGSILKKMLLFALPLFLGNVFQQLYNTVDSLIVGNFLGDLPLAAVSSSGNLIHLFIGFFQGLAMGAGILIAKHYGAREYEPMQRTIHTGVALGLCTGAVLTAVGIIMTQPPSLLTLQRMATSLSEYFIELSTMVESTFLR